ncbi:hypothetical protein EVA_19431 [gut metagenome]|uniref:Uncharacterized protein n=1 Tax=gut metagenome TaxID=749906 RepID=J9BY10_9ZZZZ
MFVTVVGHPRTSLLGTAREEVCVEYSQFLLLFIVHTVSLHVGVIYRNACILLKGNAVETLRQSKYSVDDLRQFEVGAQHVGVVVVTLLFQLLAVISKVPRLQFKLLAFQATGTSLHFSHFLTRTVTVISHEVTEQLVNSCRMLRHAATQSVVSVMLIAQKLSQFTLEVHNVLDYLEIAILIVRSTTGMVSTIEFFSPFAVVRIHHEGNKARSVQGKHPAAHTLLLRLVGSCGTVHFGKSRQLLLIGQVEEKLIRLLEQVL